MASAKATTNHGGERSPLMRRTTSSTSSGTTKIMFRLRWFCISPSSYAEKPNRYPPMNDAAVSRVRYRARRKPVQALNAGASNDRTLYDTTAPYSQVSGHISSAAAGTEVAQVILNPCGYHT